jgi:hypothetical protein
MYRVAWRQFALDELARIWLLADSAQRNAITQAAHRIDQRLEKSPYDNHLPWQHVIIFEKKAAEKKDDTER